MKASYSHIGICIPFIYIEIDVSSYVKASLGIPSGLRATKVSGLAILLQHYVNDSGSAFRAVLCRRICDKFYLLNCFRRQLLKDLSLIIGR